VVVRGIFSVKALRFDYDSSIRSVDPRDSNAIEEISMGEQTRREFLGRSAVLAIGATSCLCGLGGCATFTKIGNTPPIPEDAYRIETRSGRLEVELDKVPQLAEPGGSVKIRDSVLSDPLIIARLADETYVVASILCPHRGVEVEYQPEKGEFECASLGSSQFAADGSLLGGPAKQPLRAFQTSLDPEAGNRLIIDLSV
jgi:Rieske Fe-S protein